MGFLSDDKLLTSYTPELLPAFRFIKVSRSLHHYYSFFNMLSTSLSIPSHLTASLHSLHTAYLKSLYCCLCLATVSHLFLPLPTPVQRLPNSWSLPVIHRRLSPLRAAFYASPTLQLLLIENHVMHQIEFKFLWCLWYIRCPLQSTVKVYRRAQLISAKTTSGWYAYVSEDGIDYSWSFQILTLCNQLPKSTASHPGPP